MPESLACRVDQHARERPDAVAYYCGERQLSWREYSRESSRLAGGLLATGLARSERVAVLLPDGPEVHTAFIAAEKAGLVCVGIGPRAGHDEIRHLLAKTGARALISQARHRGSE